MQPDVREHIATLRRRDTVAQVIAGIFMGLSLVVLIAIVMGRVGA